MAREFGDERRRIAPQLRTRGIGVKFGRTRESRFITISLEPSSDYSCVTLN
jgi:hypothetical protein